MIIRICNFSPIEAQEQMCIKEILPGSLFQEHLSKSWISFPVSNGGIRIGFSENYQQKKGSSLVAG